MIRDIGKAIASRGGDLVVVLAAPVSSVASDGPDQALVTFQAHLDPAQPPFWGTVRVKAQADQLVAQIASWGGWVSVVANVPQDDETANIDFVPLQGDVYQVGHLPQE